MHDLQTLVDRGVRLHHREENSGAAKHRLLPAAYEALDDALRRANQVFRAGGVAWLIEGDDKTRLDRRAIDSTLAKRVDPSSRYGPPAG